jgi:DNA/RNA-binding protein KIN17
MGKEKGGFLSTKAIGNRIKAKGLQKLRWYCQMCQKQCRDENGFKCHCESESHQRQMAMFSENSQTFMDEFSKEFEEGMMEIIKRKARHQRQNANQMYKDFISDKQHFHMNATVWETLTDFIMYLGRTGKCEVDETEKGWFVTYIDRDPETLAKLDAHAKRERAELDSEEKHQRDIQRQVKAARLAAGEDALEPAPTELKRDEVAGGGKIALGSLLPQGGGVLGGKARAQAVPKPAAFGMDDDELGSGGTSFGAAGSSSSRSGAAIDAGTGGGGGSSSSFGGPQRKMSAMESLMQEEKARKEREAAKAAQAEANELAAKASASSSSAASGSGSHGGGEDKRKDYWLWSGIVVKVVNKRLADGKYHKRKGTIERVVDKYTGHVRMHESGDLLQLDQADLQTVIPPVGGRVLILNGKGRGCSARLLSIDEANFSVHLEVEEGKRAGTVLEGVEYEDVSKLPSA